KKKLQQYADADAERKRKDNKEVKAAGRQYIEKIGLLEKELAKREEYEAEQEEMRADMDSYISLIESGNDFEDSVENVDDYPKFYSSKILFVGGMPDMVSRLKAVFCTSTFVGNENAPLPQKTDLIVLLAGQARAQIYKYIRFARNKGIKVVYCNGTDIELIKKQIACHL
ncbi:MAG: hypothetical protein NC489_40130, partial [Ruminococcus flavefaciens]|nr:hypothetical protein [Ruminococcus flavefaciens]